MLFVVLCDMFTNKDTVRRVKCRCFRRQSHDDLTRKGRRSPRKGQGEAGPGMAHDGDIIQAVHNVCSCLSGVDWQGSRALAQGRAIDR